MKNRSRLKILKASPVYGGVFSMVLDILSIFAVPGGNRTVQEGSKRWNARGLQPSIVILIAGVIVSGISIPAYAAVGDMILGGVKISASVPYTDGSWEYTKNVTVLKEGYALALDRVYSENLSGRYTIANFSIRKNGEVVETISASDGDILYYNKTVDNIEYTIIESPVIGIFFGTETMVVILEPFYQYSDGSIISEPESLAANITALADAPPSEQWNRTFGGTQSDCAYSVQQTSDGGFILAGMTTSYGTPVYDFWLIKTDANGKEQWNRTFGGKREHDMVGDVAYSAVQTSDGGYILAGMTTSYGSGSSDVWLIKVDTNGNEQWNRTFGGKNRDYAYSVSQTSDGGYLIVGCIRSYDPYGDAWLIKTDANGNEQWSKTFGGKYEDVAYSGHQTIDGGYILIGKTGSYGAGYFDAWLIKTDANGKEQWNRTFGGTEGNYAYADTACAGHQTRDRGYILAGKTGSYGAGYFDAWLIKTDANGKEQWNRTFGGIRDDYVRSVQQTSDGGYILAGKICPCRSGAIVVRLIKTDTDGDQQWNKVFERCEAYSVQQVSDGGCVIAGQIYPDSPPSSSDVWLVKVAGAEADAALPEVSASDTSGTVSGGDGVQNSTEKSIPGFEFWVAAISAIIIIILNRVKNG
uniref:Uncharacterized protein n=1 Tax=Candidatus Methanogaster sp. ANME-2c ERB4 TaxID=2759911 RepID=A0A7G9YR80_9EURY|nr:hypothetical protein BFOKDAJI_00030 [Methanosarcinales archaeon ANME-2c ERB4]QNO50514.1 hypothetical protein LKCECFIB_00006 [Methanosarcinales archaeon ANME-2c ERB4]QNO50667.1 hypothetical protein FFGHKCHG_00021 [Methanosarcinales archaeon ANME-2c ERB4]